MTDKFKNRKKPISPSRSAAFPLSAPAYRSWELGGSLKREGNRSQDIFFNADEKGLVSHRPTGPANPSLSFEDDPYTTTEEDVENFLRFD